MNIFRKPSFTESTGDAIPFYHDGTYHIFSLTSPPGTTVYPDRLRTTWSHTISEDLVTWKELPTALYPGEGDEPDASGVWTGAALFGEGTYHIFYTGYNIHAEYQQTICHAVSDDSISWHKDPRNPIIIPNTELYEALDWRDPYVFYHEEEHEYWMLISARRNNGPSTRRGCVILYKSPDLTSWHYSRALYTPGHTNCPECSEMYKIGDTWYLSYSRFSEFGNTIYRIADTPYGPWKTPVKDGIGGRRFYAAKSMKNDEGRRFYFGWAHDRADNSDAGQWYWGGLFCVPHEVVQDTNKELNVKLPVEIEATAKQEIAWKLLPKLGDVVTHGKKSLSVASKETFSYGFFDHCENRFLFSCTILPREVYDHFGLLIKSDDDAANCLLLSFDVSMNRVSLLNLPMGVDPFWQQSCQAIPEPKEPGPDGIRVAEKVFKISPTSAIGIKALIDKDMVELFINDEVAFTYRYFAKADHEIGYMVQDGEVDFDDITIRA
ncbi:GH32 C-terminal domain-containing protein [Sediminispirochaeta smaragdinae]|uniref:beta-fructofuranosidase n=1 Tax=Sediminispirochaeta smaragdinae (strain DSM 11293 / JCM 15392 / SEBR 4228) TaxID=573413 RepID=E1R7K0_SEDSS|nr:glycoside hydrolase family 32 protein [Sediminispirochaeta smaragdinae]ADK82705.1 Glycosyl hydrolase family 32 domain protein [Sediminispirochaeta smaragdinae DSM 11293]